VAVWHCVEQRLNMGAPLRGVATAHSTRVVCALEQAALVLRECTLDDPSGPIHGESDLGGDLAAALSVPVELDDPGVPRRSLIGGDDHGVADDGCAGGRNATHHSYMGRAQRAIKA
jgi:hypothetical protein